MLNKSIKATGAKRKMRTKKTEKKNIKKNKRDKESARKLKASYRRDALSKVGTQKQRGVKNKE